MGFTWDFGFIASFNGIAFLWYPFIIFNGLQGVFIFLSFSFKRKTYESIKTMTSNLRSQSSKSVSSRKTSATLSTFVEH
ncbi:hypothetical protein B4U79_11195 [Dinothrombium tinctorium]|uniref:Uncharacterized protein n=1 Tax=Dinothrombium tinctorium TaxID=1965070 RepID=A0A3S3NEV2_9ACAR|nr:hypothetical protein B4U79_11195 [Dinothrombium tinctorium]